MEMLQIKLMALKEVYELISKRIAVHNDEIERAENALETCDSFELEYLKEESKRNFQRVYGLYEAREAIWAAMESIEYEIRKEARQKNSKG